MKWIFGVLAAIAVGAAVWWLYIRSERPDLLACEAHIRARVSDASGYKRLNVTRVDTAPLTAVEFKRQAGRSASAIGLKEVERLQDIADGIYARSGTLQLRLLTITYSLWDGAPVEKACAFRLIDGELQSVDTLMSNAVDDHLKELDTLAIVRGRSRVSRPKHTCCL